MPSVKINIYALAFANTACYLTAMVLNLMEIREHFKIKINYYFSGKLIVSNMAMLLGLLAILNLNKNSVTTLLAIMVAVLIYFASLYFLKIFNKRDLASIKYKVKN